MHDESDELRQMAAWNDTAVTYPECKCIHALFEEQAARTPDAVALVFAEQELSYRELDQRSNQLAHHLRALGVGPEVRVGLCVERSLEMVVGLLGILKAGGAYVPLDPGYPRERLAYMLTDAQLAVLLTQERLEGRLPAHEVVTVHLDAGAAAWQEHPVTRPDAQVGPDNAIYVIYTSGSTGRPKGVLNTHRGVDNRLRWMQRAYGLKASDGILQKTPLSFDVSGWELWWPLLEGARMVIAAPEGHKDPRYLAALIQERGVTVAHFVPSMFGVFLEATEPRERVSLRLVFTSGEALPAHLRASWYAGNKGELHNLYGPTEAAIDVTSHACRPEEEGPVPIGRPIDNTRTYVLDDELRPVPVGVAGELYLSGVQLARGYLNRPELTAERFVPDPFSPEAGARMYRTGDLSRWNEDGELEFLGRIDHQVKIRGFRIELGEIEAALAAHASVRACVVVALEDASGDKRLVAYVVAAEEAWAPGALREHLGTTLPEYMVPSAFVRLTELPLNPSGKVDRKALPSPEATRSAAETSYVAPRTETERALVAIWEELLHVRPIGVRDNFFLLGGHSLLAFRFVSTVEARLGGAPSVATLFRHPTIEAWAALWDTTSERSAFAPQISLSPRAAGEAPHEGLSGTERRIWFLEKLSPEARSYQIPHVFQVASALSEPALHESVRALGLRHEILRTTYPEVDGTPRRRVLDDVFIPIRVEDVSSLPEEECVAALRALLAAEVGTRFDLERGPLTRVLAVKTAADRHVVVVLQHHIITDEWSWGILLAELSSLYEASRCGGTAALPPLVDQYSDYARAERAALAGDGLAASRAYWRDALSGVPRLDLPMMYPPSGAGSGPEGCVSLHLSRETSRRMLALSRESGATPFMAWYAALAAVLARYSRQTDFGLGAVLANRQVAGTEAILGFFTNTVVLRTDLSGDPTFAELLARARRTSLDAYEHQALPFDVVVQDQGLSRQAGENPLFDVTFFEVTPPSTGAAAGWSPLLGAVPEGGTTAKNALAVTVRHGAEGTVVEVLYDTRRVSRTAAERLCGHLRTLVTDAAAHPDKRLSDLDLLTEEETEKLAAWNDTPKVDPAARCIHELIAEQALKAPEAVALEQDGRQLRYEEFEAQANRLAHHLRSLGVGPEVRVALCVERSFDMVVGLVGILKAGGAFVPLDPAYPADRLSLLLSEAHAPVLLTHENLEDRFTAPGVTVVRLDADASLWASQPATPPESGVMPEHANYVVFTSGSTGKPKPVVNEHRGLAARVVFQREHFVIHPSDRVLQSAAVAFDGAIIDWMISLCNGAACVLPSNAYGAVDGIAECLENRGITVSFIPPAMLRVLNCHAPHLRHITLAGDAASPALAAQWAKGRNVLNSYGPTEFSIFGAQGYFDPERPERFSIGRPIYGVHIYLLDGAKRPVPIGMAGEIHLAGVGLARGYLNRPGMTAERFVPDPFSKEPGARMYCTGDLARWNEEGELEFLGRADDQVKIRGFRIETGEIEAALGSHAAVGSCVVVAREDTSGDKRLVAYVVKKDGAAAPGALREHLQSRLPDYMIPSAFVFLDALPLSPNGKVDRRRLPAPEDTRQATEAAYAAPHTDAERALAEIWSEVLRATPVGIHDNFFALGGDSILAIQVVGRAKRAGLHLTVRDMFVHQTVAELSQAARSSSEALVEQGAVTGRASLTPSQHWFLGKNPEEIHHFNQAMMWTPSSTLSPETVAEALQVVLRQHDALRLQYHHAESGWVQTHAEEVALPLERVDLSAVPSSARKAAVQNVADTLQGGLSLFTGPVARAAWLHLGEEGTRLLLVVHHLVVDGVSWRILHEDLERACQARMAGQTPALAAKTTSFRQWSERLHTFVAGGGLSEELGYWQAQCARGVAPLPLDREAAPGTVGESRTVDVEFSAEETRALLHGVSAAYRTEINDVLLSALALALSAFCKTNTICVDLEGHGRETVVEDVDVSRTVGWFTAMFPVWLMVPDDADPAALLKGIKEQLRSVPSRGVGYGWLRYAHPDAAVRASLSVDSPVVFNYLGQLDMAAQGRGLLGPAGESTGSDTSPRMRLWHTLAVNGGVWQGRLRFEWTYSPVVHDASTVEQLAARFVASLRRLIAHCTSGEAFGYTPSDFPLARLGQEALDGLFGTLRGVESVYPLSPLQAGLLFHALREPESPTYTVQLALELGGEVDAAALESAWKTVFARYAVYRTSFVWQGVPEPLQVVRHSVSFAMPRYDWSSLDAAEAEARWEALQREERAAGFELTCAPLARVALVRMPGGRTWMLKTTHHILSDGWSMPVVLGELQAAYAAFRGGSRLVLPEPAPYERYIAWLATRDEQAAAAFFADYLAGVEEPTRLPFSPPEVMHAEATREHANRIASLTAVETAELTAFARRHGLTVNTVVQGALAQILGRYAGRRDVVFGMTTSGRSAPIPGIERMVGLFINTLPLRARWSGAEGVVEWLERLQAEQAELRAHEATPLYEVQRSCAVGGGRALFDTLLVFENYPVDEAAQQAEVLPIVSFRSFEQTSYPLAIAVVVSKTLDLHSMWDPAVLREEDVARIGGHLRAMLLDMIAHPDKPLSELDLLTEAERRQLAAWNATAASPPEHCIHALFEEQAARTPDAVALVFAEQELSYRELDQRSNQLAHHLRALGVGPEVRVGLCVERSLEMVVGLLGILKAGGAYVPLDPGYPRERLAYMLTDAQLAVLLTQERLQDRLPAHEVVTVHLDAGAAAWQEHPVTRPDVPVGPDNAIYVIYTSGSTGRPKGVLNTHRGVDNRLRWMQRAYGLKASDGILQKTPLSFDVSGWELWWPLLEGARMVIAAPEGHKDPRYLAALIQERGVTVAHFVPSMFGVFLEATEPRERVSLRLVFTSGEALPAHLRASWYAGSKGELHNLYGPTEAAIDVTSHACRPEEEGPVPIGRPIDNTRTYVLDDELRPVPVGVAGELYLSGVQLARVYLNRPELTAERFVPDPFSPEAGARMYRTGDLSRWNEDGELEFLGRIDHQVKIRGFRIELGEIEAALAAHASVRACVVVALEDASGDKRLVAYVVAAEEAWAPGALREHLGATLPEYMVPSAFVRLTALPLNPSGKVDRKALPSPEATRGAAETSYVAPRTETERVLVALWEELLEVRPVGAHDDFFLLGGHSLLAIRMVSGVKATFGRELTVATLFQQSTVAALAASLDGMENRSAPAAALSPAARGVAEPAYTELSGTERRTWFADKLSPEALSYQVPQMFVVRGALSEAALRKSVTLLAERQEILRTTYPEVDGVPRRVVAESVSIPVRVEDVSPEASREAALRALLEAEIGVRFDLAAGPLTRVLVVSTAAEHHVVLILQHHIVTDEWSSGVLLSELSRLYEACCRGESAGLPPLSYQFADYARAEQDALTGGGFGASRSYWKDKLAGVPRLQLPILRPASGGGPGREASVMLRIPAHASRALHALARDCGCTPFMAWYAVLTSVLSRYSGQKDFGLGAVIANREVPGAANLLGFFTNTVVLRTDLSGDPTFAELLARARRTSLDAYEHQALPFDVVVQDQGLSRQAGENPLFDVGFFEVTPKATGAAAGWSPVVHAAHEGMTTAKDALAVSVQHSAEGTVVEVLYDTRRVSRTAAERLCGHLRTLVTDAAAHPDKRLSALDLLTEEETEKLAAWNDTPKVDPAARCIHELIAEQAAKAPEAVALEQDGRQLRYGEFEAQANRLAHHLRSLGVGPEVRVALCVERSFDMVVGLVGILKAGGAFVPLDPAYPADRLSLLLSEAHAPVLLTHESLEDRFTAPGVTVVRLDADAAQWASQPATPPESGVRPEHANYVVFTSGSTGKPKPVVNEHRGLAARVVFQREHFVIHPSDRVLQSAAVAFDGAIIDWMISLCNGAACVLPSNAYGAVDGIAECLENRGITVSFIPPAMLRVLNCHAPHLRHITLAGDAASPGLAAQWAKGRNVLNSYGPTEFSIFGAQAYFDPERPESFSIGRPIYGVHIYLLDGAKRPVPIGMAGEIHLAGVGLARGYLNRPGMTAERFVPDPFSKEPGARMYCTGDLARWNEEGELEFLGRADDQVKIRGFRIEAGEIEAALGSHAAVGSCVVVAREDTPGDKRLVAYVVAKGGACTAGDLRAWIRARLPEYMTPSAFVFLDKLPLSANGKVDRKALPSPEAMSGTETSYVAPRTETERALVALWEELLEVRPIGAYDDFFLLGGHSLLAVRLVSAVKARLGLGLTVATLFQQSTVAALAASLDGTEKQSAPVAALSPAPRGAAEAAYAGLSGTERRMWFVDKLSPEALSYQVPQMFVLRGALSEAALRKSVTLLAERQEILRTTYPEVDGVPRRVVAESVSIPVRVEDVSALPEASREAALRALLEAEIGVRFDLAAGPLTRVLVVSTAAEHHVVLFLQHHIVTDEWSSGVLLSELSCLYEACCRGDLASLPSLSYQFADYARAEQDALTGGGLGASRSYWKDKLAGVPRLQLPILRPASGSGPGPEASVTLRIPADASRALHALARDYGCTPFMAWYSVLTAVLSRYSGQKDFGLGAVIANREVPGAVNLLGFFTNTVVLRTGLSGDPTFGELLSMAKRTSVEVHEHQALPFDVVVQDQGLSRHGDENPLYDVLLFDVSAPHAGIAAGWSPLLEAVSPGVTTAKNALVFAVVHDAEGTGVHLAYDTTRVDDVAAKRLGEHLRTLLLDAVAHPDKPLSELAFLTEVERGQLAAWNDTAAAYPEGKCIHDLFEEQAARTPDAVALLFDEQELTYRELDERSNQLAHYLRALGVGPEVRVGLCVERSLEMVVGLLGIVKAGGAYVPLDAGYPRERLAYMLTDARPAVLLTQERLQDRLSAHEAVTVHLDTSAPPWQEQPLTPPDIQVGPENTAYVIYTSGSTGRPKGVQVLHGALKNLLHDFAETMAVGPRDAMLAVTSLSFDIAGLELFMPLIRGASVHLASQEDVSNGEALVSALERATMMQATPATWRMILDAGWKGGRPLQVLCGGEAMTPDLAAKLALRASSVRNVYGPTETTIWSAQYHVGAEPSYVRIGRGIANTQFHVVDRHLMQVPVGIPGELYIAGAGLARGYLGRPGLTAERFVPDPFSNVPGARMYRTGDLARWDANGELEFLGRIDHQVKIRGFRIELGEIEAVLSSHPALRACAVVAWEYAPDDKRLVAYVVPGEGECTEGALREHLLASLPAYMVPSAFVRLAALPLNPSGKVDRKALPAPEMTRGAVETSYVAPRTETERALAELWSQVLQISPVGTHDNFFTLGGDSILAIQVVGRAKRAGLHLTVRDLFAHQTVAELAHATRRESAVLAEQGAVTGTVPLTPIQHWFLDGDPVDAHHFCPAMSWTPPSAVSPEVVAEALRILAEQHDALRLRYRRTDAGWVQEHEEGATLGLERVDMSSLPPSARDAALKKVAEVLQRGMNLSSGPIFRAAWVDLGDGGARLLLAMHHLVTDIVSWRIVCEDVERACDALSAGRTPNLGPKTTSLRQWSERLHAFVGGGGLSEELAYWQTQCARSGTPGAQGRDGAVGTFGDSRTLEVELPSAETRALLHDVGSAGGTEIHAVLLSALAEGLSASSGTDTVCVALQHHGREPLVEDVDVSRTVGWFSSLFPLSLRVPPGGEPAALLNGVKEQLRSVPGRGVGYGWLRYAHPDEAARASLTVPMPVLFNYLGQHEPGSAWEFAGTEHTSASPNMALFHELVLSGIVMQGRLRLTWSYSPTIYEKSTVERIAEGVLSSLRRLLAHCTSHDAFGDAPSGPSTACEGGASTGVDARLIAGQQCTS
ncbi:non-ribosomal peptide synthase/polyketide synthase [Polyangium sp. 6x1]|uniref:non-ribosomal peptide synthetase n=1 Tax=Polyangium sp. 6x1 TaxID=3042689 RepID=UPI002482A8B0|nr:non-ribosomal peptide synthase/polyketide synthase [Polyangium sp. 6x1]MDI1443592.1 non-ribosomal peptide synthase/polyketide synthase [Polyangium sp. 6x1]